MGDFNVNILLRNNPDVVKVNRFLRAKGLYQYIQQSTRLTAKGGTCIDWVISDSLYISEYGVLNDLISDHYPVFVIRKKERERVIKVEKRVRLLKNYDDNNFRNLFSEMHWDNFFGCREVNVLWDKIYDHIYSILEIMCPFKNISVRENRVPWFTNEIYECIKKRRYYVKLFKTTRNKDVLAISKYFRNRSNALIRGAKSEYIKSSLEANVANPRKYWKILNSMLKTQQDSTLDFEFINQDTKERVPRNKTADFLNEYFADVGARRAPNLNRYTDEYIQCDLLNIGNITIPEIQKLIGDIDVSKDSCVEGISASILKTAFSTKPNALLYLFDQSLSEGIFPRKWAIGYINVLPKGGDKTNPSNWRPITQTCLPAKMLEKIVQKRLLSHLNTHQILNRGQFGFRAGRSTQKAIFELTCDVSKNLNADNITGLLFLDISKAFDSLDHDILIEKLRKVRLGYNSLSWFRSYLDRVQVVRYDGTVSNVCKFRYGIPQGSCLGPTLFIFYINELFRYITDVKVLMFADDCVLYENGRSWNEIYVLLQRALDTYVAWGEDHNLRLNVNKTKAMYICNTAMREYVQGHAPFNAGNRPIMFVSKFSYLGCIIDDRLSMIQEYKAVYRRVEHKIFMLSRLRYFIDKRAALLVYKQAILPFIDYAGFILYACNIGCKKDLQILQNNALRICLRYRMVDHVTIERLHNEANLQSLEQRRIIQTLKLLYECSTDRQYLKTNMNRTRAESKIVFDIPDKCTTTFLNSTFYRGTQIWNSLPENVQRSVNIDVFSRYIKPRYSQYVNFFEN